MFKHYRRKLGDAISLAPRYCTAKLRAVPDFMIIGTQKGGTTSLYSYLVQHPQIAPVLKKEIHYFSNHYRHGPSWYRAHFPLRSALAAGAVTGEATPYYLYHPHAPARAAKLLPDVKLILLLRDPVERAFSHFNMDKRWFGNGDESFEEALAKEESRIGPPLQRMLQQPQWNSSIVQNCSLLERGIYLPQILRWAQHYPRESMLILKSEDFFHNANALTRQVWEFLGLQVQPLADDTAQNTGTYNKTLAPETEARLRDYFQPHNEALYEYIGRDMGW